MNGEKRVYFVEKWRYILQMNLLCLYDMIIILIEFWTSNEERWDKVRRGDREREIMRHFRCKIIYIAVFLNSDRRRHGCVSIDTVTINRLCRQFVLRFARDKKRLETFINFKWFQVETIVPQVLQCGVYLQHYKI